MKDVTIRQGTLDDSYTVYEIFRSTLTDLGQRLGVMAITGGDDPQVRAELWQRRRPLFEHLARTADQYWIAEQNGDAVGYARSIVRDGIWELTEYFVLPRLQSAGLGRRLLECVAPPDDVHNKVIIATTDARAQARYLKAGVYARFPLYYFSRPPQEVQVSSDLQIEPISGTPEELDALSAVDEQLLAHRRGEDHAWLNEQRQGFLYRRGGQTVGYGYVGYHNGPFAVLDEQDFPAILGHAESDAARHGRDFGVEVPLVNRAAVDYLLGRGYRMEAFFAFFMSDTEFGRFDQYIFPSPPFFI